MVNYFKLNVRCCKNKSSRWLTFRLHVLLTKVFTTDF